MHFIIPSYIHETLLIACLWCLLMFFLVYGIKEILFDKGLARARNKPYAEARDALFRGWLSIFAGAVIFAVLVFIFISFEERL